MKKMQIKIEFFLNTDEITRLLRNIEILLKD